MGRTGAGGGGARPIDIRVLGPLEVIGPGGEDLTPRGARQRRLLTALALHAPAVVSVDRLAELVWPERLPSDHHAALQTHVFRLRQLLPAGMVVSQPPGYRLDVAAEQIDAGRFTALVRSAAARRPDDPAGALAELDGVLSAWRGAPYEELADSDEGRIEAERLAEERCLADEERFEALLALGRSDGVLAELDAYVARHPLRERPRSQLMEALRRAGRPAEALRAYDDYRRLLAEELGIDPSPSLQALHTGLLADSAPSGRPQSPSPDRGSASGHPPAIPRSPSSFVGRDDLVLDLLETVRRHRLVTVLGTGGVGKTRLCAEACAQLAGRFPDGIWFVELATADPASAARAVADALGVEARAGVAIEDRLAEILRNGRALVVLDNCEHVADAAAAIAERLVATTEELHVLTTSRERLAVDGEHLFPVPPLARPGDADADAAAVRLFVDRARAVRPGFELGGGALPLVVEICRRLDGLPLAIELAAARLAAMELEEVRAGLDNRFELLVGGRRTVGRHRSLIAALSWSYDLLDPEERQALDRLSVFAGSIDAAGAAAVCRTDRATARLLLAGLVERSLLQRSGRRHTMLETVKEFAGERLARSGATPAIRRAHADFLVQAAAELDQRIAGDSTADVVGAFDELEEQLADLRVAFAHLLDSGGAGGALELVRSLRHFGLYRMRAEVHGWGEQAAALVAGSGDPRAADALAIAATGAWQRGDLSRAGQLVTQAAESAQVANRPVPYAVSDIWGMLRLVAGDVDAARKRFDEALARPGEALARPGEVHGDHIWRIETAGTRLLALAHLRDPAVTAEAQALVDAAPPGHGAVAASWALYAAGEAVLHLEEDLGVDRLRRSLALARECGASFTAGVAGATLASWEVRRGDPHAAVAEYRWLLDHWRRAGVRSVHWTVLRPVAELLDRLEQFEAAATLLGALRAAETATEVYGDDATRLHRLAEQLRHRLGGRRFADATGAGEGLDDNAAAAVALAAFERLR